MNANDANILSGSRKVGEVRMAFIITGVDVMTRARTLHQGVLLLIVSVCFYLRYLLYYLIDVELF